MTKTSTNQSTSNSVITGTILLITLRVIEIIMIIISMISSALAFDSHRLLLVPQPKILIQGLLMLGIERRVRASTYTLKPTILTIKVLESNKNYYICVLKVVRIKENKQSSLRISFVLQYLPRSTKSNFQELKWYSMTY